MNLQYPAYCEIVEIKELFDYIIGGDWGKDADYNDASYELVRCIRSTEFRNWSSAKGNTAVLRKIKRNSLEARILQEGDLLIEVSGGGPAQPVGRIVLIDKAALFLATKIPMICSNFIRLARPIKKINPRYIRYFLELFYQSREMLELQGGSNNLRNLKFKEYMKISIPIVPLAEQERIVAKIEDLFSSLDKGIDSLKAAQAQLKVYRQAVLKQAFEGRLTNKDVKEGELPEGWENLKIDDIALVGTGATPLKANNRYYENGNIPWVTSGSLNDNYVNEATDFVTEHALQETNLSLYPPGTLLIAMYGEGKTRGKCSELRIRACTNQAIAAVQITDMKKTMRPYVKQYFQMNYENIRRKAAGGVQPNLNLGLIREISIPFPPTFEEQKKIVSEIESRLSVCDKLEENISQSLEQAEALRQSILKKAFEGKLVPQDPNDEPASVLLERIRKERAASGTKAPRIKKGRSYPKKVPAPEPGTRKRGRPRSRPMSETQ